MTKPNKTGKSKANGSKRGTRSRPDPRRDEALSPPATPLADRSRRQPRGSLGRPKAETVRDHYISFRVSAEERVKLIDKASRSGMSPGEYARSRALRGIARGRKQAELPDETRELLHQLAYEARKHGVNLNQIAHHCNEHQVPPPAGFEQLVAVLNAFWDKATERS